MTMVAYLDIHIVGAVTGFLGGIPMNLALIIAGPGGDSHLLDP